MPELRKDPISDTWVIISTERGKRPSDFGSVRQMRRTESCAFCEGHEAETPPEIRAIRPNGGPPNSPGWKVRVIPNKFAALRIEGELGRRGDGVYDWMNGIGCHEVIVETPRHDEQIIDFSDEHLALVLDTYRERILDLRNDQRLKYVQVFKNYGQVAGASLEHAHSQVIGLPVTPRWFKQELQNARFYYGLKERCLFCDILRQEAEQRRRYVYESDAFFAFCPYASRFPFEIWLLPKQHSCDFTEQDSSQLLELARALRAVLLLLNLAVEDPPYNWVLHTASILRPRAGYWDTIREDFHWHIEIIPRLTKMAGFEWGTGFYINPTPPEQAAAFLREHLPQLAHSF